MKKAEKITFVEDLTKEFKDAKSLILVNYSGLNVTAQQELKKRLKEAGGRMVVVKNTLLKRAGEAAKVDPEMLTDTVLSGQTALVLADTDPVGPIQVLGKFSKEFTTTDGKPLPKFKVGMVEGMFQDEKSLSKLATLPSRDALLGQVLGALIAPQYGIVGTLNANLQKLVYVLSEASKR